MILLCCDDAKDVAEAVFVNVTIGLNVGIRGLEDGVEVFDVVLYGCYVNEKCVTLDKHLHVVPCSILGIELKKLS